MDHHNEWFPLGKNLLGVVVPWATFEFLSSWNGQLELSNPALLHQIQSVEAAYIAGVWEGIRWRDWIVIVFQCFDSKMRLNVQTRFLQTHTMPRIGHATGFQWLWVHGPYEYRATNDDIMTIYARWQKERTERTQTKEESSVPLLSHLPILDGSCWFSVRFTFTDIGSSRITCPFLSLIGRSRRTGVSNTGFSFYSPLPVWRKERPTSVTCRTSPRICLLNTKAVVLSRQVWPQTSRS